MLVKVSVLVSMFVLLVPGASVIAAQDIGATSGESQPGEAGSVPAAPDAGTDGGAAEVPSLAPPTPATPAVPAAPSPAVPVVPAAAVPVLTPPSVTSVSAVSTTVPAPPLAGFAGDVPFLRSPDDSFILIPSGRLQVDSAWFWPERNTAPFNTFMAKRARLEMCGWVGRWVYFIFSGEFSSSPPAAGQSQLISTDAFIALAPFGDLLMLQVGQFNVPFTLENRSSDKYIDFVERSVTVRSLGVPAVRDQGAMLWGVLPNRVAHYSLAVLNGEGENFRNSDNQFDLMGRGWVAPLAITSRPWAEAWRRVEVGGSFWTGRRPNGRAAATQSTIGGVAFWSPTWTTTGGSVSPMELRQYGRLRAWALELDAPITHRFGARAEFVHKHQQLIEEDVSHPSVPVTMGNATLDGWSVYGQVWAWLLGDDRILPAPGMSSITRVTNWNAYAPPQHGLMAVARFERLSEDLKVPSSEPSLGDPSEGTTRLWSLQVGLNYWYSKRFRATVDYAFYDFSGSASSVQRLPDAVHELLTRLAIAL